VVLEPERLSDPSVSAPNPPAGPGAKKPASDTGAEMVPEPPSVAPVATETLELLARKVLTRSEPLLTAVAPW
jgi:hypothetical protein